MKSVLHEPTNWYERIGGRPDVRCGGERRIKNDTADFSPGRERNGDASAERLAPQHNGIRRVPRDRELVSGQGVADQPGFAWLAGRAAIAAIGQREETRAIGDQPFEAARAQ